MDKMVNEQIRKVLREEARKAEELGKLTETQLEIIYENKWFHLLVPKHYGGAEMDLPSFALLMEELATIDGAFAWNVNLGAGANMFAGYLHPSVAKEIFANPKTCIAGSGACTGVAKKVNDSFIIDGFWKYASGSAHANYFSLNAVTDVRVDSGFSSFIVPADAVEVLDSWKTSGLKATASHDFSVSECTIPESYAFNLLKPSPNCSGNLYRFPFQVLAEINMLVMSTGLTLRFLELAKEIATEKKSKDILLADSLHFKNILQNEELTFLNAREGVFTSLSILWEQSEQEGPFIDEDIEAFSQQVLLCAEYARRLVDRVSPFMGMHLVFESSELNRVWRDFKVASQHSLLSPARLLSPY